MILTNHAVEKAEEKFGMGKWELERVAKRCVEGAVGKNGRIYGKIGLSRGGLRMVFGWDERRNDFVLITVMERK